MRGLGLFFGVSKRNQPLKLTDPRPIANYGDDVHSGDAGKDGYTRLSIADPDRQGHAPQASGVVGPAYQGPDQSWEQ